jgi:hypothetical protein
MEGIKGRTASRREREGRKEGRKERGRRGRIEGETKRRGDGGKKGATCA